MSTVTRNSWGFFPIHLHLVMTAEICTSIFPLCSESTFLLHPTCIQHRISLHSNYVVVFKRQSM